VSDADIKFLPAPIHATLANPALVAILVAQKHCRGQG
jgi:hypothetical protein